MALFSVVVPIYNVEPYVRATLESLQSQTHRDVQVVMVNDGSTDGSDQIAAEFAQRDGRFQLHNQENGGLGHARNTGARLASGDFITFVDSDDVLPHYACQLAVRTLEATGSDFLSGNEYRFDSRGAHPAPMLQSNFAVTRLRTNVTQRPSLMRDLLPHNKIYRKSFWDAAGLEFPEGILFEDGPVSVRAHALAQSVDVVSTPVYYWRLRDDASRSLTQLFDDKRFFVDRIYASRLSADFLEEQRPDLLGAFYSWDIKHKFPVMYKALPGAPREVQEQFMHAAVPHLKAAPQSVVRTLAPALRRRVLVNMEDDLDELLRLLPHAGLGSVPTQRRGGAERIRKSLANSVALRSARAYLKASPSRGFVRSTVTQFERHGDMIRLRGFGHVAGLPANGRLSALNRVIWVRHHDSRRLGRLRFRSTDSPEAVATIGTPHFSYARSGFEAELPLSLLKTSAGEWCYGEWVFAFGAVTPRGLARNGLRLGAEAYRVDPLPIPLDSSTQLVPTVTNGVLGFRIEDRRVVIESLRLDDGAHLTVTGRASTGAAPGAVIALGRIDGLNELTVPVEWREAAEGGATFDAVVPLADVVRLLTPVSLTPTAGYPDRLYLGLVTTNASEGWQQVACRPGLAGTVATVEGHHVVAHPAADGLLCLTVRPPGPVVESAGWTETGELILEGTGADNQPGFKLIGRHSGHKERRVLPVSTGPDGTWTARVNPESVPLIGGPTALRAGLWRLVLRLTDAYGNQEDVDIPYSPQVFGDEQKRLIPYRDRYALKAIGIDGIGLRINSRLPMEERGPYNAAKMRRGTYQQMHREADLREVILYDSFNGKQYSDAPRAVHERLSATKSPQQHLWVTRDGQAPIPAGTRTVEANSREWFEALATSRYVVANTHLPGWFRRREGQVVAQTWHGIGFKKVAFDMPGVLFANKGYLESLEQEAPNWSFLVSPSSFCTDIMRRAFRYEGEILEIGSPRNDVLITGDREFITARVRRTLGIPYDKKILLYAPTWRDDEFYGRGRYKFTLHLDVSQFPSHIQEEYVLLVRRHPNAVDDVLGQNSDFVFDVANYPDVRDLLVATDVLITDYSTISLDFVNTGRPVLFYAYDLAKYRDNLRGFYFDLEHEGPGPVIQTTHEVIESLQNLEEASEKYRDRYARFHKMFCHAEDGHATERLIERLLR
jgi:CDP-glycerol glycerophosphotransferase